jgi:hypothetical protein
MESRVPRLRSLNRSHALLTVSMQFRTTMLKTKEKEPFPKYTKSVDRRLGLQTNQPEGAG